MGIISVGPYIVRTMAFTLDELETTEVYPHFNKVCMEGQEMVAGTGDLGERDTFF